MRYVDAGVDISKSEQAKDRIRRLLEKKKLDQHLEALRPRYPVRILDPQFQ